MADARASRTHSFARPASHTARDKIQRGPSTRRAHASSPRSGKKQTESPSRNSAPKPKAPERREPQKANAYVAATPMPPLLGPKIDLPALGPALDFLRPLFSSGQNEPVVESADNEIPKKVQEEIPSNPTLEAMASIENEKGFYRSRKNLPLDLRSESGKKYTVPDFFNKWKLAENRWVNNERPKYPKEKTFSQELADKEKSLLMEEFQKIIGPLRPTLADGSLGQPIDYPAFIARLNDIASPADWSKVEKFLNEQQGNRVQAEDVEPIAVLVAKNNKWMDWRKLDDLVFGEMLRSEKNGARAALAKIRQAVQDSLELSSEDEVVNLQTRAPRTVSLPFNRVVDEIIAKNASSLLSFQNVDKAKLNQYESEGRADQLKVFPKIGNGSIDRAWLLEKFNPRQTPIGYVSFIEPNPKLVAKLGDGSTKPDRYVKLANGLAFLTLRHDRLAEILDSKIQHEQPHRESFSLSAAKKSIDDYAELLSNVSDRVFLFDLNQKSIGALSNKDWIDLFGIPVSEKTEALQRRIQAQSNRVSTLRAAKSPPISLNSEYLLGFKGLVSESKESDVELSKEIIQKAKNQKNDSPILLALSMLGLSKPKDNVFLQMQDTTKRILPFENLVHVLRNKKDWESFTSDELGP